MKEGPSPVYEFGDFRVDTAQRQLLRRDGESVPLSPKAFDTLLYLVEHSGKVLDKDELMTAVWPDTVVEQNNLNQSISALRRALGERRDAHNYIATVSGRGYRFIAQVSTQTSKGHDWEAGQRQRERERIIAVLPFKPLVAENRNESLELGMADTLIVRLSGSRELTVRPLSSVRRYCGLEQDSLAAGRALGVNTVLDGSIQTWGDRIRVSARLLSVADGRQLWAGKFDEKFTDIFAVQDAISERVAAALTLELSGEEKRLLTRRYTENAEAYRLYLKGRFYWLKATPGDFVKSRDYFRQAAEADPTYPLAYTGLADYYGFASATGLMPPDKGWPRAEAAVTKALELDDTLAEVYNPLAALKMMYYRDWAGAEGDLRRGIGLNPKFAEIHNLYAFFLAAVGRFDEATLEGRRALELDPLSLRYGRFLGDYLYYARRYDEAVRQYQETLELDPNNPWVYEALGDAYERRGMYDEAIATWRKAMTFSGDEELAAILDGAYAAGGFAGAVRAVARERLERLDERRRAGEYVSAINYARAYVRLGDEEQSLRWLGAASEERNNSPLMINSDPLYDGLRADPRFAAILNSIHLE